MRMIKIFLPCIALLSVVAGCTLQEAKDTPSPAAPGSGMSAQTNATGASAPSGEGKEPTSTNGSPSVASSPAATPPVQAGTMQAGGPGGVMPQGMPPMAGVATAPLTKTPDLDKKVAEAEKSGDKKKIGAAYAERGTFRMNDDAAGAKVKYRAALDDYRKALAADPTNTDATTNKKLIEDIYKSMGRPVPGEEGQASPAKP